MSRRDDRNKRIAKKRERKAQKRKQEKRSHARPTSRQYSPTIPFTPVIAGPPPRKFTVTYPNAGVLEEIGPMVIATFAVPAAKADQLRREGKPVPSPVTGNVLVDTGARHTAIAKWTADQLGLTPHGMCTSHGAHGEQESERFFVNFSLSIADANTGTGMIMGRDCFVMGIPRLKELFDRYDLRDQSGNRINVIGLLGREFLRHTRMTYNGPGGTLEIEVDTALLTRQPLQ